MAAGKVENEQAAGVHHLRVDPDNPECPFMTDCRACPFLATCTKDTPDLMNERKKPPPKYCPKCGGLMALLADGSAVCCLLCSHKVKV